MPIRPLGLSPADHRRLLGAVTRVRRTPQEGVGPPHVDPNEYRAPDVYVARTPSGGISGMDEFSGTGSATGSMYEPGFAFCDIWRLDRTTGKLVQVLSAPDAKVYNFTGAAVGGNQWVLVCRDKFGTWWVCGGESTAGVDIPTGTGSDVEFACEFCWEYLDCDCVCKHTCTDGHGNFWTKVGRCSTEAGQPPGGGPPDSCEPDEIISSGFTPCNCSPRRWSLTISGITDGTCTACATINGTWTLAHDGGTTWTTGDAGACGGGVQPSWQLVYNAGFWTLSSSAGAQYILSGALWDCDGPNVMTLNRNIGECVGWLSSVTLTAV